ncbi:MAG: hypothetical protein FJW23_06395 [Acidimicrobiia bacterium]|nr:hypothetical protein [Acidimicrobiia bacterium]
MPASGIVTPFVLCLAFALPAAAQTVTPSDIQRLQDNVFQAGSEVSQLRAKNASLASTLQTDLDDLREEVIYLKVKLRKDGSLTRAEYADVRDRLDDLRSRARGEGRYAAAPPTPPASTVAPAITAGDPGTQVPVGTEVDVRLIDSLNSGTAMVEDRFQATTLVDLSVNGRVVVPAGSEMRGVVTAVERATRTNRTARMTVSFDQVTIGTRSYPIRAMVTQAMQGEGIKGEAGRLGAGAIAGAVIGGLLGGGRGALAGVLIGGGGTLAATEGKELELPQGTTLRIRFDSPATIG